MGRGKLTTLISECYEVNVSVVLSFESMTGLFFGNLGREQRVIFFIFIVARWLFTYRRRDWPGVLS